MPLSFEELSATNKDRCEQAFHSVEVWRPSQWTNAMSGEVGETCAEGLALLATIAQHAGAACNTTKKMDRIWPSDQFKESWNKPEDQRMAELEERLAGEIADVVIYADLLMTRIGRSLGNEVRKKFNDKSDEIGSSIKL